eukprot:scaffold114032_cov72-Phaeocystis_antarctica.AAC.1
MASSPSALSHCGRLRTWSGVGCQGQGCARGAALLVLQVLERDAPQYLLDGGAVGLVVEVALARVEQVGRHDEPADARVLRALVQPEAQVERAGPPRAAAVEALGAERRDGLEPAPAALEVAAERARDRRRVSATVQADPVVRVAHERDEARAEAGVVGQRGDGLELQAPVLLRDREEVEEDPHLARGRDRQ